MGMALVWLAVSFGAAVFAGRQGYNVVAVYVATMVLCLPAGFALSWLRSRLQGEEHLTPAHSDHA